jgi:hypothetical protein
VASGENDGYDYPVEQCSVEDRAALIEFRQKRRVWLSWLRTDEHHAIWSQITAMAWNDTVFRVLNEARNPVDGEVLSATNGMLGGFINQGYISAQVLAIRRLVDNRFDVISLRRLLRDVRAYRPKLTRELYVSYDGLPYDYEEVGRRVLSESVGVSSGGFWYLPTKGPDAYDTAHRQHTMFDRLSGVTSDCRARGDIMADSVFETLERGLDDDSIKSIVTLSHKFLAHAADATSRSAASLDQFGISPETVSKAHKAITLVAQAVTAIFADATYLGTVPTPQFNVFEGLDRPYVSSSGIRRLRELWHAQSRLREDWCGEWQSLLNGSASAAPPPAFPA